MSSRTAGIIVIGDEILKGMTRDTNSLFMSKKLYSMGIKLKKISVIPDEVDTIAAEISEFSKNYDLVLTSGGIGPTHDDVTYEGVAKAFGEKLELNKEMAKYVLMFNPGGQTVSTNPALKMANLPTSAEILQCNSVQIFSDPIVVVHNVVIFPGIPQLLEKALSGVNITDLFPNESFSSSAPASKFHCHKLYYKVHENRLIKVINKAVGLFGKSVSFGCYPVLDKSYETVIVVDSSDELLAARAHFYLKNEMPDGIEVRPLPEEVSDDQIGKEIDYYVVSREVSERVFQLFENHATPKSLLEPLDKAIKTVEECFSRYQAGTGAFISFNGGKDCTALLHLIFALYTKCYPKGPPLTAFYIKTIDPFPELEEFVREAALRYNIQLHVQSGPLKEALERFISEHDNMKAVFIGTRRTDPRSISLQPFQMTDGDWPKIMRVSPLLDWSYENVWTFLRQLSVPYCSLYDKGYTSLGDQKNTFPNPALSWKTDDGETKYHPAYMLKDETVERSEVLDQAAELTSALAEVIAPAFGPNGLAVLFTRECSSAKSTGISPIISRTGLQIMEILVLRNSTKCVHPLLKSLLDSCRILEHEWGDGVKSLVLITSELLRQCSALECVGRPGWLKKELGKAVDFLSKSCEFSDRSHLYGSTLPPDGKQFQEKHFQSTDEEFNVNTMNYETLMKSSSQFISTHYPEVLTLLKMFFNTRFPSHVVEVVPNLLCDWVKSVEKDSRDLNFVVDNFSPLCHVNVGFPMDHCFVLDGVLVQGYGIGCLFTSNSDYFHKETCRHYIHSCGTNGEKRQSDNDGCHGCISINVEIITEHEVTSAFEIKQDQFEFKTNYLYVTSCIPSDFIKFKICQLGYISLIHSVPSDDVDFLRYLMHDQKSSHLMVVDCFFVNWVKTWPASPSRNSGLVWLGVPHVRSLMLSVPVMGMKDGLKRSCQNALSLIHQFNLHFRHRCTENIKLFPPQNAQSSNPSSGDEPSNYSLDRGKSQIATQKGTSPTNFANILPLKPTLCFEKLLSNHVSHTALENLVPAGGLAEIYLHDMVITWWLTPSNGGGEYIDREVTKAIALAILTVPISLSTKGKLLRYPRQPLTLNFSSKSKELIAHRLRIVQLAVSVAFSLSNISDVMVISKSASRMNLNSSQNLSSDDDDDD